MTLPKNGERSVKFQERDAHRINRSVAFTEGYTRKPNKSHLAAAAENGYIRRVSWSGNWEYNTNKTVTILGTSDTVKARNMLVGLGAGEGWITMAAADSEDVDEDPAVTFLVAFDYTKVGSYSGSVNQFLGHNTSGILTWYGEVSCEE